VDAYKSGLFAPSAGQNMREEQRRRRSQYDRGTSLAEREEYHFDESEYVFPRSYAGPSRCELLSTPDVERQTDTETD